MRKWIDILTESGDQKVRLIDLYTPSELRDESERLAHSVSVMEWDIWLPVRTMSAEEARGIKTRAGNSVLSAYEKEATKQQKKIVAEKIKDFDDSRIIVLELDEIIDGNHHLIAAIKLDKPVRYIDLADLEGLMEDASVSRFPKPFMIVTYDDDYDEGNQARVFKNPVAGLLRKIIGQYDCRALIDTVTGDLYAWPELDCFHDDVAEAVQLNDYERLMLCNPDSLHHEARVSVKGETVEPVPFTDEKTLALLQRNRGLKGLFGENFAVDTYDWR